MPLGKEYEPFGAYVLVERLAAGGMAEVFLARQRGQNERTVVVKRMHASINADPDARARFLDESRVATLMTHPNIVRVLDVGIHAGAYFMVMEWLLGWELREILERAHARASLLPVRIAVKLAFDAATGLAAAHDFRTADGVALNLVHRDIGPRNLFVTADGVLKVLDFGLAKSSLQRRHTEPHVVMGTYGYIAPEQLTGGVVDRRTDVFSLGVVLHELLTGKPLFARGSPQDVITSMLEAPILPPVRDSGPLDGGLVAIVMRMVQRRQEWRFADAAQVARELGAWLAQAGAPSEPEVAEHMTALFAGSGRDPVAAGVDDLTTVPDMPGVHVAVSRWADELAPPAPAPEPVRQTQAIVAGSRHPRWPQALGAAVITVVLGLVAGWYFWKPQAPPPAPARVEAPDVAREAPPSIVAPAAVVIEPPAQAAPPVHRPAVKTKHNSKPRPAEPTTAAVVGTGRLTLDARPWANVYLGRVLLGPTPLVERELPAGVTSLRLVDPVTGREQVIVVEIPSGGDVRRVVERQ